MSARRTESSTMPLAERLRRRIRREGAITFREWMEAALYDGREGYYVRVNVERWGRAGDYRTSPERSPLFAATFAHYFAHLYDEVGGPPVWTICEAGAGAGHFARGVLDTLRRDFPRIFAATRYLIDEASPDGRERAAAQLKERARQVEFRLLSEINEPVGAGVVFANELLDAFPVHRVRMRNGKLYELFVGLDEAGKFIWIEDEPSTPQLAAYLARSEVVLPEGHTAEINLAAEEWMKSAASVFRRGYIVLVDYGREARDLYTAPHRREGTLRAIRRHRFEEDVLARPGEQDLTTTIDWTNVRRVGEELGLRAVSFSRQDEFLLGAGILDRLESATREAPSEAEATILRSSARELILPGGMSQSFQVLVFEKQEQARK